MEIVLCGGELVRLIGDAIGAAAVAERPEDLAVLHEEDAGQPVVLLIPWPPEEPWLDALRSTLDQVDGSVALAVTQGSASLGIWREAAALGLGGVLSASGLTRERVEEAAAAAAEAAGRLLLARRLRGREASPPPPDRSEAPSGGPVLRLQPAARRLEVQEEPALPSPGPAASAGHAASGGSGSETVRPAPTPRDGEAAPTAAPLVAVVAPKGGAGTSLVAAGLARAFAEQGRSTSLIELSRHGSDQRVLFGLRRRAVAWGGDDRRSDVEELFCPAGERLWVVPGLAAEPAGPALEAVLGSATGRSELVILDLPPDGGRAREVLRGAAAVVVVMVPEALCVEQLADLWEWLFEQVDMGQIVPVLNRAHLKGGLDRNRLVRVLGQEPAVSIPDDAGVRAALAQGHWASGRMGGGWGRAIEALARAVADKLGWGADQRGRR